jgi:hypothetical protein
VRGQSPAPGGSRRARAEISITSPEPTRLARSAASWSRILVGVALAPLVPAGLGVPIIWYVSGSDALVTYGPTAVFGIYFFLVGAWSIVMGLLGTAALFCWRGSIDRGRCVYIGMIGAASLPIALGLLGLVSIAQGDSGSDMESYLGIAFATLGGLPFGALGGLIYWQIVRTSIRHPEPGIFD